MEAPLESLLMRLADFTHAVTGVKPPLSAFKPARDGYLGLSAFVRLDAPAAARALSHAASACLWEGVPLLEGVEEKGGWLLFAFTPAFFEKLVALGKSLPPASPNTCWGNRLHILTRKGNAPCPEDFGVRQTLFLAFWSRSTGKYPPNLPQRLLTMTHIAPPAARLELEKNMGAVARALLGFMGEAPYAKGEPL